MDEATRAKIAKQNMRLMAQASNQRNATSTGNPKFGQKSNQEFANGKLQLKRDENRQINNQTSNIQSGKIEIDQKKPKTITSRQYNQGQNEEKFRADLALQELESNQTSAIQSGMPSNTSALSRETLHGMIQKQKQKGQKGTTKEGEKISSRKLVISRKKLIPSETNSQNGEDFITYNGKVISLKDITQKQIELNLSTSPLKQAKGLSNPAGTTLLNDKNGQQKEQQSPPFFKKSNEKSQVGSQSQMLRQAATSVIQQKNLNFYNLNQGQAYSAQKPTNNQQLGLQLSNVKLQQNDPKRENSIKKATPNPYPNSTININFHETERPKVNEQNLVKKQNQPIQRIEKHTDEEVDFQNRLIYSKHQPSMSSQKTGAGFGERSHSQPSQGFEDNRTQNSGIKTQKQVNLNHQKNNSNLQSQTHYFPPEAKVRHTSIISNDITDFRKQKEGPKEAKNQPQHQNQESINSQGTMIVKQKDQTLSKNLLEGLEVSGSQDLLTNNGEDLHSLKSIDMYADRDQDRPEKKSLAKSGLLLNKNATSNIAIDNSTQKRKRRIIKRIVKKRAADGSYVPIEITRTIVERDGSKSITREQPQYEASVFQGNKTVSNFGGTASLDKLTKLNQSENDERRGQNQGSPPFQGRRLEQVQKTQYETTAYRSSSGAIVLNRVSTIKTIKPNMHLEENNFNSRQNLHKSNNNADNNNNQSASLNDRNASQTSIKRRTKRIIVKKKKDGSTNELLVLDNSDAQGPHHYNSTIKLNQNNKLEMSTYGQGRGVVHMGTGGNKQSIEYSRSQEMIPQMHNLMDEQLHRKDNQQYEKRKQELENKEKELLDKYHEMQEVINNMRTRQENLMKLQAVKQEQHILEMEESKVSLLNASKQAVELVSNLSQSQGANGNNLQNSQELNRAIREARMNLSQEEDQIRQSLESFERQHTRNSKNYTQELKESNQILMQNNTQDEGSLTNSQEVNFQQDRSRESSQENQSRKNRRNQMAQMQHRSQETETQRQQQNLETMSGEEEVTRQNQQQTKQTQQQQYLSQQHQQQNAQLSKELRMSFRLARTDSSAYSQFLEQILFGSDRKSAIMNPIPFAAGQLRLQIERNKSGFNKMLPQFNLYIDKLYGNKLQILFAKKRAFNKTANYLISLAKNNTSRDSDTCLGKLRALEQNDQFVLYDNGENYSRLSTFKMSQLRTEHGFFMYRYEPCNVGNIRKMIVVMPQVSPDLPENLHAAYNAERSRPETIYNYAFKYPQVKFVPSVWRPIKPQDTLKNVFLKEGSSKNQNMRVFVDNPPQWNPKTNTYVYDFKGRVTQPSIKNFQLIPEADGRRNLTLTDFVLQFGKNGSNSFILDVQFPFSIYQAFGLALSAFDTE